jgi:hypothetical protein
MSISILEKHGVIDIEYIPFSPMELSKSSRARPSRPDTLPLRDPSKLADPIAVLVSTATVAG